MRRLLILSIWFPITLLTIGVSLAFLNFRGDFLKKENIRKLIARNTIYNSSTLTSVNQVLGAENKPNESLEEHIFTDEQALEKIPGYFAQYGSPMTDSSIRLIEICQEYDLDPFLIAAIAQCESNLGKKVPEGCNNPFGLGFYGGQKICFDNWEESYEFMAKTLRNNYLNDGLETTEEIMQRYNPYSMNEKDGHWAKCVNSFLRKIDNFGIDYY